MSTSDYRKVIIGDEYQGCSGTPAMSRSRGSGLLGGFRTGRCAWLWRPGFFLRPSAAYNGQGVGEVPWTGQDITSYGLIAAAPNTNAWKRFLNCQIQMTCVPDPATGSSASPPSNPGTGTSAHDYQANINQYVPTRTITVNAATLGSGTDARFAAPFAIYVISDTLVVNINTDTEVKFTETILLGYNDPTLGPQPGTVYTITLVGHWWNGTLPSVIMANAYALFNSVTTFTIGGVICRLISKDSSGTVQPSVAGPFTSTGEDPWPITSLVEWPGVLPYASMTDVHQYFGYYRPSPANGIYEMHIFFANDFIPVGPNTHGGFATGTYTWTLNKFNVGMDGTVTSAGTVSHPTLWANDRFICEPDGLSTLYVPTGDVSQKQDSSTPLGYDEHF